MTASDQQQQVDVGPLPTVVADAAFLDVQNVHVALAVSAGTENRSLGVSPRQECELNMGCEKSPALLGTESTSDHGVLRTPSNKGSKK